MNDEMPSPEYCLRCQKVQPVIVVRGPMASEWSCAVCHYQHDVEFYDDEENGDVEFYLSLFRTALGVDRETIINANIAKLSKRYKERFTPEEATNRDTATEANIIQEVIGDPKPSDHEKANLKPVAKLDELTAHSQAIGEYDKPDSE